MDDEGFIYDGRLVPVFITLTEAQENKILSYLIDFLYYNSIMSVKIEEVNENKIFQYFVENIKKPLSLDEMLLDMDVEIDAINYIGLYYKDIVKIKGAITGADFNPFIDIKKEYQREDYLKIMMGLLEQYKDKEEVKAITNYLDRHKITLGNISDDYIKRIVDKVYAVI